MNALLKRPGASSYRDRHGRLRWRFRLRGIQCPLPGAPGEPEFEQAYAAACRGEPAPRRDGPVAHRPQRAAILLESFVASALQGAKERAALKGVPFAISKEELEALMRAQGHACAITGISFLGHRPEKPFRPSLDRIKPAGGYVPGNVRIVCEIVNLALSNWGEAPLNIMVDSIVKRRLANRLANRGG